MLPLVARVLPQNHVEHRGLARAVRTYDDAQLLRIDVEVQRVHGLEAVKGDSEIFNREEIICVR